MKPTALISLVYDRIRWDEKALITAAKKAGVALNAVDAKLFSLDASQPSSVDGNLFGNTVIQRCISYFRGLHITAFLETLNLPVVNSFKTSLTCGNKLFTTLSLIKAGLPTPRTLTAFTPKAALQALDTLGYPAVLKPVVGSWGRLVTLVKDRESAQGIIETRSEIKNALLQIYYIQELVERPPRDIRVIVIGDEVIAASYRYSSPNDWRTNVARGGISKPCPLTPELEHLSIRASHAVGGGVVAVDCMEGQAGLLVIEVNNTIEFQGISTTTDVDIAAKIIDYAIKVAKK